MFNKVIKHIQNELIDFLGATTQQNVDAVLNHFPDGSMVGHKTICILRRRSAPINWEIGKAAIPTHYSFFLDLLLIVNTSTDEETSINDLESLERRVIDYLGRTCTLRTLSVDEDNQIYRVIDYLWRGTEYPESIPQFDKDTQVSIIQLEVRLQHITNA